MQTIQMKDIELRRKALPKLGLFSAHLLLKLIPRILITKSNKVKRNLLELELTIIE